MIRGGRKEEEEKGETELMNQNYIEDAFKLFGSIS